MRRSIPCVTCPIAPRGKWATRSPAPARGEARGSRWSAGRWNWHHPSASIAAAVGISQGNLTYHFPAKSDLALRIASDARESMRARRASKRPGKIPDDYVDHLLFAMGITWANRFLLRDRAHFARS